MHAFGPLSHTAVQPEADALPYHPAPTTPQKQDAFCGFWMPGTSAKSVRQLSLGALGRIRPARGLLVLNQGRYLLGAVRCIRARIAVWYANRSSTMLGVKGLGDESKAIPLYLFHMSPCIPEFVIKASLLQSASRIASNNAAAICSVSARLITPWRTPWWSVAS